MTAKHNSIFSIRDEQQGNRVELLDFLRGASMLLVLLHHSDAPFGAWLLAFHMPLMFALSGYTMFRHQKKWKFWDYFKNRVMRLVVPYFLFEGLNLFVWCASLILQGGWQDLSEAVTAIVTCVNTDAYTGYYGRLWFWPCMFVSDVLFYLIIRLGKRIPIPEKLYFFAVSALLLAVSWYTSSVLPYRLPFAADTALMATFFLAVGFFWGEEISWLLTKRHRGLDGLILAVSLIVLRESMLTGKAGCYMFINLYGDYGYTLAAALGGSLAFLVIAKWLYPLMEKVQAGKNLILWYGRNSLVTFPVHLSIKIWMWNHIPWEYRPWYVLFLVMLIGSIPIVNLITNYFPFMLGRLPARRKQKA